MRPLGDSFIVTGEGIEQINFNKMISMNATAAFLWESLEGKDFTVQDVKHISSSQFPEIAFCGRVDLAHDFHALFQRILTHEADHCHE